MPKKFAFDLYLTEPSVYETGKREALVIEKIGTDALTETDPANLKIDNKPVGPITNTLSPLHKVTALFVPLLDLGPLFYVVPPETEVRVEQPAGAMIRCKGYLLKLALGEVMPTNLMARFHAQPNHYLSFLYDTYTLAPVNTPMPEDAEYEVISYTPNTIQKIIARGLLEAKVTNYAAHAEQELAVRFFLDGAPLDFILDVTKTGGIDLMNTPYPPDSTEYEGFILDTPVEVLGDHTLSVRVRNISGAAITPDAGTSLIFDVAQITEYLTGV